MSNSNPSRRLGGAGPWRFGWHIPPQIPGSDCGARSVELCIGAPMTHAEGQRRREGPFPWAVEHPRSTLTHSFALFIVKRTASTASSCPTQTRSSQVLSRSLSSSYLCCFLTHIKNVPLALPHALTQTWVEPDARKLVAGVLTCFLSALGRVRSL